MIPCIADGIRAIPACAGRTGRPTPGRSLRSGPSPRVRGERPPSAPAPGRPPGHPRVCGENADHLGPSWPDNRAIPACAGRTVELDGTKAAVKRAIPACAGRTYGPLAALILGCGPSPRVRGERLQRGADAVPLCFDPTDPDVDWRNLAEPFDISETLANAVVSQNEYYDGCNDEQSRRRRWRSVRDWAVRNLTTPPGGIAQ